MEKARLNGVTLEYEVKGSGEPVLLITGAHMAAGYLPFMSQGTLFDRYQLIRYHKRGLAGSSHTPPPFSLADHAADAARLLDHLAVGPAHIVGHSSGGSIALQLALDRPEYVRTLVLLEPAMLTVPGAEAFIAKAGPSLEAYAAGDHAAAVALFLSAVSGLDWETCRSVIEEHVPGGVAQAVNDADTFFGIELPALGSWTLTPESAATITRPVLSVLGTRTEPVFVRLRTCFVAGFRESNTPRLRALAISCTCSGRSPSHAALPGFSTAIRRPAQVPSHAACRGLTPRRSRNPPRRRAPA
jgi:pimeloyl-ACP methyl ester carboxylesterase